MASPKLALKWSPKPAGKSGRCPPGSKKRKPTKKNPSLCTQKMKKKVTGYAAFVKKEWASNGAFLKTMRAKKDGFTLVSRYLKKKYTAKRSKAAKTIQARVRSKITKKSPVRTPKRKSPMSGKTSPKYSASKMKKK